jgi:hypothetical protein
LRNIIIRIRRITVSISTYILFQFLFKVIFLETPLPAAATTTGTTAGSTVVRSGCILDFR